MGRDLPEYPTLFAKYPEALIGAFDPLTLPAESDQVDREAELAVVVGRRVRHAGAAAASEAIAGYSIINDVTLRDWEYRTPEWLQGKTFEATTPFGPHLVTPDEIAPDAKISCLVDGEVVQDSTIADLLFGPVDLVRYISTILPLDPGDVIATGTRRRADTSLPRRSRGCGTGRSGSTRPICTAPQTSRTSRRPCSMS
jgi:acylpyruvate hydrolase